MKTRLVRRLSMLCIACGAILAGGCAGSQDRLQSLNRSLTEENQRLTRELAEARDQNQILASQQGNADELLQDAQRRISERDAALRAAQSRLDDLDRRMSELPLAGLDPETDQALADLARQFPSLVTFDSQRGMLRFSSDLTFDSGSANVRPEARTSLEALAQVLTATAGRPYEIRIVGHTDSQPISAGTARNHPTNMHLSCHRAIAVRSQLATLGVDAGRMQAAGWGSQRPLVPNTSSGNTPQNRRVEVFLTRSTRAASSGAPTQGSVPVDGAAPPTRQPDPTK